MNNLEIMIENYLTYCQNQKRLDRKTLKAYRIDLKQFSKQTAISDVLSITSNILENFIADLHQTYQPKTVKRKVASLKALFHYLEFKEIIEKNPFNKVQVKFREPVLLPKTIPLPTVEHLLLLYTKNVSKPKLIIKNEMH